MVILGEENRNSKTRDVIVDKRRELSRNGEDIEIRKMNSELLKIRSDYKFNLDFVVLILWSFHMRRTGPPFLSKR